MKPRNKFQQQIATLSKTLPKLSTAQQEWAYKHCIDHIGRRTTKGVITCLECAHQWTNTTAREHCTCPECGAKLQIQDTRQRVFTQSEYLCIATTCEGYQVLRFFFVEYNGKVGERARYSQSEVVQRWIAPDGKHLTLARLRPMGYFVNTWNFGSALEIRPEKPMYNVNPTCVYPRQTLISQLRRSGYDGNFHNIIPSDLLQALLSDYRAETLLKTGQTNLLRYFIYNSHRKIDNYFQSIRIAIRNGYTIEDGPMWCDYIDLLRHFGKDLCSAKYICPDDLKAEHDKYVKRRRAQQEEQRKNQARQRALENEAQYKELKGAFFGIEFTDGKIRVRVLESVEEIMHEGDYLKHCVFANEYHLRPDSLILSASINDERIETVELSLSKLKVVQSRGLQNKITEHHDQIIKLVNKNAKQIQRRIHQTA